METRSRHQDHARDGFREGQGKQVPCVGLFFFKKKVYSGTMSVTGCTQAHQTLVKERKNQRPVVQKKQCFPVALCRSLKQCYKVSLTRSI